MSNAIKYNDMLHQFVIIDYVALIQLMINKNINLFYVNNLWIMNSYDVKFPHSFYQKPIQLAAVIQKFDMKLLSSVSKTEDLAQMYVIIGDCLWV